jgi:putative transposase
MDIGPCETETFRTAFPRPLARRGRKGVEPRTRPGRWSPTHPGGLKTAIARVLHATWRHCRVHFMRNPVAHADKSGRRAVAAFIATTFAREEVGAARTQRGWWPTSCGPRCPSSPP